MLRQMSFLLACGLLLACTDRSPVEATGVCQDIVVQRAPEVRETAYTISVGDCRISWTVYESEPNLGTVRHRSDCGLPWGEQTSLIRKLLRKIIESEIDARGFRTLTWGRLYPDGAREATLAVRLAIAAKKSASWDSVRGTPRGGDINNWIRKLANDALIYDELRPIFRESGLELRLTAVEKVLVLKARLLPFFDRLREAGVLPEDRVPFDCQAWFSVQPVGKSQQ